MSLKEREVEMRHLISVISIYRPADQCIKFFAVALLTLNPPNMQELPSLDFKSPWPMIFDMLSSRWVEIQRFCQSPMLKIRIRYSL